MNESLLTGLAAIVGPRWVRHRRAELATYTMDGLPTHESYPGVVVLPGSREELIAVVKQLHATKTPFVARGAGTGLSGGALAESNAVLVALTRLNRIISVDPATRRAVVEPGVVNARLSEAVLPHGLQYVPDPSSQTACTIGRQRRRERRRPALPQGRRHHQSRHRPGDHSPRRHARPPRLRAWRRLGTRPRRPLRRQRGNVRHRLQHHRAARTDPRRPCAPCSPISRASAPPARPSPPSSPPASCPPRSR